MFIHIFKLIFGMKLPEFYLHYITILHEVFSNYKNKII